MPDVLVSFMFAPPALTVVTVNVPVPDACEMFRGIPPVPKMSGVPKLPFWLERVIVSACMDDPDACNMLPAAEI